MSPGTLLLPPASGPDRRRWIVDENHTPSSGFVLGVKPGIATFGSVSDVWSAFTPQFLAKYESDLERLNLYFHRCQSPTGHQGSGPSLALRRRISRESGPATRAIELGAMLLLEGLAMGPFTTVHVVRADELDGLSLRLVVRAVLRMTDAHEISFVFHSTSDPRVGGESTDLAEFARCSILRNAALAGQFSFDVCTAGPLPPRPPTAVSIEQSAVDLVAHNYEAAFLRTECAVAGDAVEGARIRALAAVNLGNLAVAESMLESALGSSDEPGTRAHLCCLLALIAAKRRDDRGASDSFIDRGLELLDSAPSSADKPVERAWLLNARALNKALEYQRTGDDRLFKEAHALETEASRIVSTGSSPERTYLRFNILANLAFLWEGRGDPNSAARVFERRFADLPGVDVVAAATIGYRLAVLYAKAGRLDEAQGILGQLDWQLPPEEWSAIDHLLRVKERVALQTQELDAAQEAAECGVAIGRSARSFDTVRSHAGVLAETLRLSGRPDAVAVLAEEMAELGVDLGGPIPIAALRPKLPAYIPEIDLEDVPMSDTNRRLAGG